MRSHTVCALIAVVLTAAALAAGQAAQQVPANPQASAVPGLVSYNGVLHEMGGKTLTVITGVTFLIYKDEQGGAPLWLETQSVTPDGTGHYSVQLGSASAHGIPSEIFQNGEARWLAIQIANELEQPRTLLVAVPYAMKAKDAETVGGLPPSAFVLAAPPAGTVANWTNNASDSPSVPPPASNVTTTGGTASTFPIFTTATNIQNSILTQTAATAVNVLGRLNLPATGVATAAAGKASHPEDFVASSFSSSTSTAVNQTFQLEAEPAANDTANPSGTLNLLYGLGATTPSETGLKISSKGLITFAGGQTFPGTGKGSVTSVGLTAPGSDFSVSGSPVTTSGTLNIAWKVAPTNADTANAIVKRDGSGNFSAGAITAGSLAATGAVTANSLTANGATINGFLSIPAGSSNAVDASSSSPSATTIFGEATSSTGDAWGVEGYTNSSAANAYGVYGEAAASTGTPIGVYGLTFAPNGIGIWGQQESESTTAAALTAAGWGPGVWGDGGTVGQPGVIGTSDNSLSGYFVNNSGGYGVFIENLGSGTPFVAGNGTTEGSVSTYCEVDSSGNIDCTGSKNAVVPVDGGARTVALSAIESPQNWFEDFGSAQLTNGAAVVELDSTFTQTVNTEKEYQVFLTPYGDCKGLYVTNRTAKSFEVHELGGGTATLKFGYRITAIRKNYEQVRFADHTHDLDAMKRMQARPKPTVAPGKHDPGAKALRGMTARPASLRKTREEPVSR